MYIITIVDTEVRSGDCTFRTDKYLIKTEDTSTGLPKLLFDGYTIQETLETAKEIIDYSIDFIDTNI